MSHLHPDADAFQKARRELVQSVACLTAPAMGQGTLAARNLTYHAEEMMRWMDAFYSGRDPDDQPADE